MLPMEVNNYIRRYSNMNERTTKEGFKEYLDKYVTVFLMNGYQLKGKLVEVFLDGGVRVVDGEAYENTVSPQSISTIRKA